MNFIAESSAAKKSSGATTSKVLDDGEESLDRLYASLLAPQQPETRGPSPGGFMCDLCGVFISSQTRGEHELSILHLFNAKKNDPPVMRRVQLSEENVGFKMLTNMGFDEGDGGLGERRQGRLDPIATTLKMDTRGLGFMRVKNKCGQALKPRADGGDKNKNDSSDTDEDEYTRTEAEKYERSLRRPRVTHFPSHVASERLGSSSGSGGGGGGGGAIASEDIGLSRAKIAQDILGGALGLVRGSRCHKNVARQRATDAATAHAIGLRVASSEALAADMASATTATWGLSRGDDPRRSKSAARKRRRRTRKNRRALEERLEHKREKKLRSEFSGSIPEGYEEYFD